MKKNNQQYWNYIPELDGLRAISILLVVVAHFGLDKVVPGGLGVTIFFFVSGFIITRLLLGEAIQTGQVSLRLFYLRRFFRLMPALVLFIFTSTIVLLYAGWSISISEVLAALFYWANYYHIFVGFHGANGMPSPFIILWSLAVEEHFYLAFPIFLHACGYKSRVILKWVLCVVIAVLIWRSWLVYSVGLELLPHDRVYKGSDTRLDAIMFGAILAILYGGEHLIQRSRLLFPAAIAGTAGIVFSLCFRNPEFRESLRYTIQGISLIPLVLWILSDQFPKFLKNLLTTPPLLWVGRLSYSVYLFHWLGFCVATWLSARQFGTQWMLLACSITIVGSLVSYYWVEKPMLAVRKRYSAHG